MSENSGAVAVVGLGLVTPIRPFPKHPLFTPTPTPYPAPATGFQSIQSCHFLIELDALNTLVWCTGQSWTRLAASNLEKAALHVDRDALVLGIVRQRRLAEFTADS